VQMRAVTCKSEAIHATLINHEAYAAKRRATISLAHDVFYWNAHRKAEFLRSCTAYASSQKRACGDSGKAWSSALDALNPSKEEVAGARARARQWDERARGRFPTSHASPSRKSFIPKFTKFTKFRPQVGPDEAALEEDSWSDRSSFGHATRREREGRLTAPAPAVPDDASDSSSLDDESADGAAYPAPPRLLRPEGAAAPLPSGPPFLIDCTAPPRDTGDGDGQPLDMTNSMISLVDGLMTWGGQYDQEDDQFLPSGMAVSIALEESAVMQGPTPSRGAASLPWGGAACTEELADEGSGELAELEDSMMGESEDDLAWGGAE